MNATKTDKLIVNGTQLFTTKIPIKCPYCCAYVEPLPKSYQAVSYNDSHKLYIMTYWVNCCKKLFFSTYLNTGDGKAELLCVYPPQKPEVLPAAITSISPRFVSLYNQAFLAETNNHFELAGCGYRNAIEVLIKDFAITELDKPEDEVCKKSLNDTIKAYMPSVSLTTSADVVRLLGNDFTHYERKYNDIEFDVLKQYLKIFINAIENEYLINHPPVQTKAQQT